MSTDPEALAGPPDVRRAWIRPAVMLALFAGVIAAALLTDFTDQFSPETLRRTLRGYGYWAPAALLAAYAIRPLLLLPISPLWVASGAFFGWLEGTLWSVTGTGIGAGIGFGVARHLGRAFVERRLGPRVSRWAGFQAEGGLRAVLALQLTPIVPHDLINNLAGISRMPYRAFLLGSLLGTTPIILVYTYVGYAVWEIPSPPFWIALGILTLLTVVMLVWNRRVARRKAGS
ncbi:MAG: TVP38/TMEM64 family protein [Gemmatimonadota bacterium]